MNNWKRRTNWNKHLIPRDIFLKIPLKRKALTPILFNSTSKNIIVMKFVGVCEVSADRLVASMKMI